MNNDINTEIIRCCIMSYKGYSVTDIYAEYDEVACSIIYYGKLDGIKDLVNFHAFNLTDIEQEFHNAVNDYLDFCKEVEKEPEVPQ